MKMFMLVIKPEFYECIFCFINFYVHYITSYNCLIAATTTTAAVLRELSHKALGYTFITVVVRIKVFTAMSHERTNYSRICTNI